MAPEPPKIAAGRPVGSWLSLFALTHQECAGAWERIEWPDGAPLLRQPWPLVRVFEVLRDELRILSAEQSRRAAKGEVIR